MTVLMHEVAEGVATLTLNRPEKRNALNAELVEALKEALRETARDDDARVVVLRGAGPDFCSGADLAELERVAEMGAEESLADARSLGALFALLREHPKPVVAAVHGRALAGGCGLATGCDLVVASSDARMGYPEVHLGFVPALVMTVLRRKVGEAQAFHLVATGERFGAEEAHRLGLVTKLVSAEHFEAESAAYVAELAAKPASALRLTKSLLYELDDLSFPEGIERAAQINAEARRSPECREGVRRFLERSRG